MHSNDSDLTVDTLTARIQQLTNALHRLPYDAHYTPRSTAIVREREALIQELHAALVKPENEQPVVLDTRKAWSIMQAYDAVYDPSEFELVAQRATDLIASLLAQLPGKELPAPHIHSFKDGTGVCSDTWCNFYDPRQNDS